MTRQLFQPHNGYKEKATRFVGKRYKEWREMLANARGNLLSPSEIKGLLGEMYFLKDFLCTHYGAEKAALSWTGPKRLPQDYIIGDTWFEVKTEKGGFHGHLPAFPAIPYSVFRQNG